MTNNDTLAAACNQIIVGIEGLKKGSDRLTIELFSGNLVLEHQQDCCERVTIEDFEGDIEDLLGHQLVSAEEVVEGTGKNQRGKTPKCADSTTWTFYKFRTTGGDLWIRWLGESNGYYSESVHACWTPNGERDDDQ